MKHFRQVALIVCAALAACEQAEESLGVSETSYHGVEFGMTLDEASGSFGSSLNPLAEIPENEKECFYVFPDGQLGPVRFMVYEGRVVRVDVESGDTKTLSGVGIGSLESEVQDAYAGRLNLSPHKYTDGNYLTLHSSGDSRILFETDGVRVVRYRAGILPTVEWFEGCL